jgi:hypothetical protein
LKSVDFPTFGLPTIATILPIDFYIILDFGFRIYY